MWRILVLLGPLLGAAIRRAERRIQDQLLRAQAVSADTAVGVVELPAIARWRLSRLQRVGVVRTVDGERFYWDEAAWNTYRRLRRRRALTLVGVVVGGFALVWLFAALGYRFVNS